jgi:hypothetical protein
VRDRACLRRPFRDRIPAIRRSFAGKGQALSEAPSVGGGAPTGQSQVAQIAGIGAEAFAAQFIRRVLTASQDLDPIGLHAQLDLAATVLGLARCLDDIVMPTTRLLRRLLVKGQHDAAQELMAIEAVRTWLNHRGSFAPSPQEIGPILLACGPRDRHTVGLESMALLLRFQRWPCQVLGARISTFTLTIAARAAGATGVVVTSSESRARPHAIASLRAIDALGIPVFFAGSAFEPENSRTGLPGRYLGTSIEAACILLINTLAPAVQRPSAAVQSRGSQVHQ